MFIEPDKITDYSKEQLVDALERLDYIRKEADAEKQFVCEQLISMMEQKQEMIGDFIITKVTRKTFKKPSLEWAIERGCTKTDVDMDKVKELVKLGAAKIEESESTFIKMEKVDES